MLYPLNRNLKSIRKKYKLPEPKKVVFLLGAGSVSLWKNGASSKKILEKIRNNKGFFDPSGGSTVGNKIFEILTQNFHNEDEVNFETIIAFIEELLNYVFSKEKGYSPNDSSIIPIIYDLKKIITEIKDYEVIGKTGEIDDAGNEIFIFRFPKKAGNTLTISENVMEKIYFSSLLKRYIESINSLIKEYDDLTFNYEKSDYFLEKIIQKFISNNIKVRFYTTNYDRKLPNLFGDKFKIFDGFTDEYTTEYEKGFLPDSYRILTDFNCINYYNLHGSVYWENKLYSYPIGYQFKCFPNKHIDPIPETKMVPTNPGQNILLSNIVTGYNKVQRLLIPPINLFYQAFYHDIIDADTIVVVGYSLKDNHINRVLSTAFQIGNPKILFIDYFEEHEQSKLERYKTQLELNIVGSEKFKLRNHVCNDYSEYSNDKKQFIYKCGFAEFLKNEENWKFLF